MVLRVISDASGVVQLADATVHRIEDDRAELSFCLPRRVKGAARTFRVDVPWDGEGARPQLSFRPVFGETAVVGAEGDPEDLRPQVGMNSYLFHETGGGEFSLKRENSRPVEGGDTTPEKGGGGGMDRGEVDENGNLVPTPAISPSGRGVVINPHTGKVVVDPEPAPEGYVTVVDGYEDKGDYISPITHYEPEGNGGGGGSGSQVVVATDLTKKPFGVYEKESSDSSSGSAYYMYLPEGSLQVNGEPVEIEDVEDNVLDVGVGELWCAIEMDTTDIEDDDGSSSSSGTGGKGKTVVAKDVKFSARIVDSEEKEEDDDQIVFAFRVADVKAEEKADGSGEYDFTITQLCFGAVVIDKLESFKRLVPFQLCETRFADEERELTIYRLYTPRNNSVQFNGTLLSISGSEGNWYPLHFPNDRGVYSYVCWLYEGKAVIGLKDEFKKWLTTSNKSYDAVFPVVDIVVGDKDSEENADSGVLAGGPVNAVIAAIEMEHGQDPKLTGALITANSWTGLVERYGGTVTCLRDRAATHDAVLNAFRQAAAKPGIALFVSACHGGANGHDNFLSLFDGVLTDAEIWSVVSTARAKVWLVFDSCHSKTMYGPPSAESMAKSLQRFAASGDGSGGSSVEMLCWASCADDQVGWYRSDIGGIFSQAIMGVASDKTTYASAWQAIVNNNLLKEHGQVPQVTVKGSYFEQARMFDTSAMSDDEDDEEE